MSAENPFTYGFRAIRRDPVLLLVEILWRWCFGGQAVLLLLGPLVMLPGTVAGGDATALRSRDPLLLAQACLRMLTSLGGKALLIAAGFLLAATALWTMLGAIGRTVTLNRLDRGGVRFRSILALQCLRGLFLWVGGIALVATITWDARIAGRGAKPDLFLYSALAVWSVILIGVLWAVVNWHLSLAAVCCAKNAGGFGRSIGQALGLARSHSADLAGVTLVFAVLRLIALAVAFVLLFLPSGMMGTAPRAYFAWVIVVTLSYFVASNFLYISRMAAYLVIDTVDSDGKEMGTPWPSLSGSA